jgi:hypothetical protein
MQTNRVELTGNLADRVQERRLPSGTRVANARLAQSYIYDTKDGALADGIVLFHAMIHCRRASAWHHTSGIGDSNTPIGVSKILSA